ncbi:hypothetical protein [Brevundimonas sp. NIBR11]|uniref:hypothetical protein n=1 Tax=Brevundimonas sp. NIBR11 TaxID=3015999 RepID=UPI0022F11760|nr:hypothetical protein [Brevundimonas sp. NIBR11]WGM31867.1 hypothetical protein KKHFBJBL_02117 [Brevundimonas sp. NIBR11]
MAFDAEVISAAALNVDLTAAEAIDIAGAPCPVWAAANPDRALAWLFVAPNDCLAVDVLTAN